ncbi:MAG: M16 family metallopeptidase [Verrucomicrobiales bacterium]
MKIHHALSTFANGARLVTAQVSTAESVSAGIWLTVGGRHEPDALSGCFHFLEHMVFKGTKKRSALRISADIEDVGGSINAFTAEDHTCFYAHATVKHLPRLLDVLFDMLRNPKLDPKEVIKEREVILEEITSVMEQPAHRVTEILNGMMYPRHPLGRPITGTKDSVSTIDRSDLQNFLESFFQAGNMVIAVTGPLDHSTIRDLVTPYLRQLPRGKRPRRRLWQSQQKHGSALVVPQQGEQAHLAMGFHTCGRHHPDHFALRVLSVALGEIMASRLFQKLRERRAFCYHIHSSVETGEETGNLVIQAALHPRKLHSAIELIWHELNDLAVRPMSAKELSRAKEYICGQNILNLEGSKNQMYWIGECLCEYGKVLDPEEVEKEFRAVTQDRVLRLSQQIFQAHNLNTALLVPEQDFPLAQSLVSLNPTLYGYLTKQTSSVAPA